MLEHRKAGETRRVRVRVEGRTTKISIELRGLTNPQRQDAIASLETIARVLDLRFGQGKKTT